jgi:hypothetical protein
VRLRIVARGYLSDNIKWAEAGATDPYYPLYELSSNAKLTLKNPANR